MINIKMMPQVISHQIILCPSSYVRKLSGKLSNQMELNQVLSPGELIWTQTQTQDGLIVTEQYWLIRTQIISQDITGKLNLSILVGGQSWFRLGFNQVLNPGELMLTQTQTQSVLIATEQYWPVSNPDHQSRYYR